MTSDNFPMSFLFSFGDLFNAKYCKRFNLYYLGKTESNLERSCYTNTTVTNREKTFKTKPGGLFFSLEKVG